MPAFAYLLPPLSGLVAYVMGRSRLMRFHGLQSVLFGSVWPTILYACAWITPGATQVAFLLGAITWVALAVAAARGRDAGLPVVSPVLRDLAATDPLRRDID
ncbi:MAG: hypothetical protein M3345_02555 [Actinomycetota bacterium]|nr:hypothetical protein [Actinomycetota bacterium]